MKVAAEELEARGFRNIEDTSATASYDYSAKKDEIVWMIEVKGTTSATADSFLLTASELRLHRDNKGATVLIIVYDINLQKSASEPRASGGTLQLSIPWDVDDWDFEPRAFCASRRRSS